MTTTERTDTSTVYLSGAVRVEYHEAGHAAFPRPGSVPSRWPADHGRVDGRCDTCGEPIHAKDITADWMHTR